MIFELPTPGFSFELLATLGHARAGILHTPRGDIKNITGFKASANGRELKWVRDNLDVFAFHIDVPQGVTAIDVSVA